MKHLLLLFSTTSWHCYQQQQYQYHCCCCCCCQPHSHPTGSGLNLHLLANCQCGNEFSNSIGIFQSFNTWVLEYHVRVHFDVWTYEYLIVWILWCFLIEAFPHLDILIWCCCEILCNYVPPNPPSLLLFYKYPRLRSKKMWKCLYVNVSDDNEWRKIKV